MKRDSVKMAAVFVATVVLVCLVITAGDAFAARGRPQGVCDLDVTYISRTPRYYRYHVQYPKTEDGVGVPRLKPGTENQKRWPLAGEKVKYTAHVMNKGNAPSPSVTCEWLIDGKVFTRCAIASLSPGEEAKKSLSIRWKKRPQKITFRISPSRNIREISRKNNSLTIGSYDLTLSIWVERGLYDMFNRTKNIVGTYSFEDWIQAQVAMMNKRFAQARYRVAPSGIKDRVRIDKIVVAEDLDGPQSPLNRDPHQFKIDGRWQFKDNDHGNRKGRNGEWKKYINRFITKIDWGLIHELAHQLGVIDLYRMNLANRKKLNMKVKVTGSDGQVIPVEKLPTAGWNQILFKHPGIMAGGTTRPYKKGNYFSSHTAAGLNSNFRHRRGFYGEYLFDTPRRNYLLIVDKQGRPISNARVKLYQKHHTTEWIDNEPELTGVTDSRGMMRLKNRPVKGCSTTTGHTLGPNPFGQIDVVGRNGTMLIKIIKNNREYYSWLYIIDLNLAYWSGKTDKAVYKVTAGEISGAGR